MEIQAETLSALYQRREKCKKDYFDLQRWPSYFDRRFFEFLSYMEVFPKPELGTVLELGCGNGYQSALLAEFAVSVEATDLPDESLDTHSPGMKTAIQLLEGLRVKNVNFTPCSAESLPFPDNYFDTVYSSHVTEHIPELNTALNEIFRVLKPGGIFCCIVPASFDKPYAFLNYYLYLISRVPFFLIRKWNNKFSKKINDHNSEFKTDAENKTINVVNKNFPFPPPHGAFPDFITEYKEWKYPVWKKKILEAAPFKLLDQRTTQFLPFMPLMGFIMPVVGTKLYGLTRKFERAHGKNKWMQYFGINTVLLLQK